MENRKMEIIQELMEELQGMMEYGEDDLSERLGRPKPESKIEVMKLEAGDPLEEEGMEMAEGMDDEIIEESPEDKLKNRLMKLRG